MKTVFLTVSVRIPDDFDPYDLDYSFIANDVKMICNIEEVNHEECDDADYHNLHL